MLGKVEIRIAGGMSAVGERNGMIIARKDYAIAIDWGQKIPEFGPVNEDRSVRDLSEDHFPDISQIEGLKLELLCLTHGHQDHTEGWWKLRERERDLVIATHPFTKKVIHMRVNKGYEKNFIEHPSTFLLEENIEAGPFRIRRFPVNHSIPGACGFLVEADNRRIVHLGDVKSWRIRSGVNRNKEVFEPLLQGGIDHLFLDATNAAESGYVISEEVVEERITAELQRAPGRVFFATISSNLRRQESVIRAARKLNKPVIVIGSAMRDLLELDGIGGWRRGYQSILSDEESKLTDMRQISPDPADWPYNVVVCVSGSQGEPSSFLDNWAEGKFYLPRRDGDILILSQDTIPLPEIEERLAYVLEQISEKVDEIHLPEATPEFTSRGADVFRDSTWHASGHGMEGDLKLLLDIFQPRVFTPCHADREKREMLAALGKEWGYESVLLDDGDRYTI